MKYIATSIFALAQGVLPFVLPDNGQFVLPALNDNRNIEEIFSSLEKSIEQSVDRTFEVFEHAAGTRKQESYKPATQTSAFANNHYVAAFADVTAAHHHHDHQDRGSRGDYPGQDDTDPRDGTDPGDGPPYYRSPKEPPHHTPMPPSGIPRVPKPKMPPRDRTGPHNDKTLWDMIKDCKYTSRFYEYLKDDDKIVKMLQDTKSNTTVFAPSNQAFEKFDQFRKHHDVSKDMVHRVLLYHLSYGIHRSNDLRYHNTLVTMLPDDNLGKGMHQRVRLGLSHRGPTINFYSEFKMLDIFCKNGVIHAVDSILLPPPDILELVEVLPTEFSTSTNALARAGLLKELSKAGGNGLTIFVPSNRDWQKLGFKINAFLFSESGKPYLRALMKYHISPGNTLYSDALVTPGKKDKSEEIDVSNDMDDRSGFTHGYSHAYMPTMLEGKHLSVDITRLERFLSFRINGIASIIISDGIAKSGSIQVPDHVLMPPLSAEDRRHMSNTSRDDDEEEDVDETQSDLYAGLTVADLKSALEPHVRQEREELKKLEGLTTGEL
jgi:uncharacterized surface protein with fasciclin (FAS1) repeats